MLYEVITLLDFRPACGRQPVLIAPIRLQPDSEGAITGEAIDLAGAARAGFQPVALQDGETSRCEPGMPLRVIAIEHGFRMGVDVKPHDDVRDNLEWFVPQRPVRRITSYNVCYTKLLRGAILLVKVPATIITSAWRGLGLNTTPNLSKSYLAQPV